MTWLYPISLRLRAQRRTHAARRGQHHCGVAVGLILLDLELEITPRDKDGAGDVPLHKLLPLADIDENQRLAVAPVFSTVGADLFNLALGEDWTNWSRLSVLIT